MPLQSWCIVYVHLSFVGCMSLSTQSFLHPLWQIVRCFHTVCPSLPSKTCCPKAEIPRGELVQEERACCHACYSNCGYWPCCSSGTPGGSRDVQGNTKGCASTFCSR